MSTYFSIFTYTGDLAAAFEQSKPQTPAVKELPDELGKDDQSFGRDKECKWVSPGGGADQVSHIFWTKDGYVKHDSHSQWVSPGGGASQVSNAVRVKYTRGLGNRQDYLVF